MKAEETKITTCSWTFLLHFSQPLVDVLIYFGFVVFMLEKLHKIIHKNAYIYIYIYLSVLLDTVV